MDIRKEGLDCEKRRSRLLIRRSGQLIRKSGLYIKMS